MSLRLPAPNPPTIFVDTNVWLDYFIPHRLRREDAVLLLETARALDVPLAYASQSILDVYYRVQDECKRWWRQSSKLTEDVARAIKAQAWDFVNVMQAYGTAVPVDASDVYEACRLRELHNDLEDNLILAACQRAKASFLVTNDKTLLAHATTCAKIPRDMVRLMHTWT